MDVEICDDNQEYHNMASYWQQIQSQVWTFLLTDLDYNIGFLSNPGRNIDGAYSMVVSQQAMYICSSNGNGQAVKAGHKAHIYSFHGMQGIFTLEVFIKYYHSYCMILYDE